MHTAGGGGFQVIKDFMSPTSGAEASELPYPKGLGLGSPQWYSVTPMSHNQQGLSEVYSYLRSTDLCVARGWGAPIMTELDVSIHQRAGT